MVLSETLESLNDFTRDIAKTITKLKVLSDKSDKMIEDKKYIKAYKSELDIESELRYLALFLEKNKSIPSIEMRKSIESASKEALFLKCKKIENMFQQDADNDDDDFGEE